MNDFAAVLIFLKSTVLGLLIGLERERHVNNRAGLRTFTLIAVVGTVCALLAEHAGSAWLLAVGLFAVAATMVVAYSRAGPDEDAGTTTTIAAMLCYGLGAMVWYGLSELATTLGLACTALLYFKTELHSVSQRMSRRDLVSFLQFAAITFVVLPALPDRGFGPFEVLNPYHIWLMVVVVSGVSLAGYVGLRLLGEGRALPLVGALGGLVSSTATTLTFSRHARDARSSMQAAALVILIANLAVLLRLAVIAAFSAPHILPSLAPLLVGGLIAGAVWPLHLWSKLPRDQKQPADDISNPAEIGTALKFAAVFALLLLVTAWLNAHGGTSGVYLAAAFSGLTDVDAISLSVFKLFNEHAIDARAACTAVLIAFCSNLVFKAGIVVIVAGRGVRGTVGIGYLSVFAGLALSWLAALAFGR